jgi:lipopolysaccharide transport system ATP-binding protein
VAQTAVRAEGLGKRYRRGRLRTAQATTLRDAIVDGVRSLGRRPARARDEEFWALEDVSFEVEPGECLGVVGRNGAGKSTLLKVLSRITAPSEGRFSIRGRVASLLEVGTGFHPELTGRENVFLNGAILGMTRREILARFDEIAAFSEVEAFLDTPVKRYSSGMHMRLAFAVAAHLEAEILLVDEVLAVGDVAFQRKCLGKMRDVARTGRTVLFVCHNLAALRGLCQSGLVLDGARVVERGDIARAIQAYLALCMARGQGGQARPGPGFRAARVIDLLQPGEAETAALEAGGRYALELECELPAGSGANVGFTLFNDADLPAVSSCVRDTLESVPSGRVRLRVELPVARLPSGRYRVEAAVWDRTERHDQSDALLFLDVVNPRSALDVQGFKPRGATLIESPWTAAALDASGD